jgi:tRNA threonylcarbamoyladenosine biosynthesis protein TsaE
MSSRIEYPASSIKGQLQIDPGDKWPATGSQQPETSNQRPTTPHSMLNYQFQVTSRSIDETQDLSQKLGELISRPLIIALIGDLGSGKTAFVQGLAKGLDVPGGYYITSPTFTLINEYPGRHALVHVDLYRLENVDDFEDIGLDEILHGQAVVAIEWADKLSDALPAEHLLVAMEIIDNDCRRLILNATGQDEVDLIKALEDALSG